jgi:hypothetical protein
MKISKEARELIGVDELKWIVKKNKTKKKKNKRKSVSKNLSKLRKQLSEKGIKTNQKGMEIIINKKRKE